jgi:hypothetical protein
MRGSPAYAQLLFPFLIMFEAKAAGWRNKSSDQGTAFASRPSMGKFSCGAQMRMTGVKISPQSFAARDGSD